MPGPNPGDIVSCEPAQSKCTWTFEKSQTPIPGRKHFARACAVETHMDISQEPFCMEMYRKDAARAGYHLDQTAGLNPHRKPLQCGHTVWGITDITAFYFLKGMIMFFVVSYRS